MDPTVAAEVRVCSRHRLWYSHGRLRDRDIALSVVLVAKETDARKDEQRNHSSEKTGSSAAATWFAARLYTRRRLVRAEDMRRPLLPLAVDLDLERQPFANRRAIPILWKRRDMHEDIGTTLRRRDESEAAVVMPLGEFAFNTHGENRYLNGLCRKDSASNST